MLKRRDIFELKPGHHFYAVLQAVEKRELSATHLAIIAKIVEHLYMYRVM